MICRRIRRQPRNDIKSATTHKAPQTMKNDFGWFALDQI